MARHCRLLLTLSTLILSLIASGTERRELIVWGLSLGPDSKGLEDTVLAFERRHPYLDVKLLGMGAGGMNPQKLMTSIVGRVPPDVIFQDRFTIADWASRNAFLPLCDLIERDRHTDPLTPTPEQYYEPVWREATFNGRVYAIPDAADNRALYWNRERFREKADELRAAGLDPERPPRTWSEILAYSRVLTEFGPDGRTLVRAGFLPNFGNSWLYMYAFQMNAEFISPDGRTCTLYTPQAAEALQFMVDGYDILGGFDNANRFQSGFQGGEHDPFITGRVAMKIDGDWTIYGIARFAPQLDFGVDPAPVPDDRYYKRGEFANEPDTYITWAGGFSYAIPRGARNIEDAWNFIKFFTSLEGRTISLKGQQELERRRGRTFVARISAHRETNLLVQSEFMPVQPSFRAALQTHIDLMDVARVRPATFAGQILWDEHVRAVDLASRHIFTPAEALQRGSVVVQRFLDEVHDREKYPIIDLRLPAVIGMMGAVLGAVILASGYRRHRLGKLARHEARWGYILILPWVFGFLVFTVGPMIASIFFSFTQYNVLTEARWVGWRNYQDLFTYDRERLLRTFGNVLYLGGIGAPLGIISGLAVAMLLNTGVRAMRYYRTIYYMPAIVPGIAATVLWMWILNADPNRGLVSAAWAATITHWFDVQPPGWLMVEHWAKPSLLFMGMWGAGAGMILWLAGLKGIPNQLYEAASIDGANPRQQFWTITLPMLTPLVFFNTVMGFIGALQTFDSVYVITGGIGGGPNDALLMPVYHLFINAFNYFKMGYASALAWVIFLIIVVITAVQFYFAKRWVYYEVDK